MAKGDFFDTLCAPEIEQAVIELETRIRSLYPEVTALFVKPQSVLMAGRLRKESPMTSDPSAESPLADG